MTHDVDHGEGTAPAYRPAKRQKTSAPAPAPAPAPPPIMCCICRESLKQQDLAASCPHCRFGIFCRDCLRDWFLKATVDETRMPVKCCDADIPVKKAKGLLTAEEIKLYEAKYDEWSTFDKFYCPVPQCSAFIPSKLYLCHPSDKFDTVTSATKKKKNVTCPACHIVLCTTCRGRAHSSSGKECTRQRDGFDPKLEAKLKKWGIKRCPKCNAGVRLMYGCPHVRCRCSYSFCFGCLKPIEECEGRCGDGYNGDGYPDDDLSEDDVDIEEIEEEDEEVTERREDPMTAPPEDIASLRAQDIHLLLTTTTQIDAVLASLPRPSAIQTADENQKADAAVGKDDSDIDLDDGVGSDLDLGSDPDEPQEWQCRHTSWTRTKIPKEGWPDPATVCNWCKASASERVSQGEANKTPKERAPFTNTISEITNPAPPTFHSMMICMQCGIRMCENCAKALGVA